MHCDDRMWTARPKRGLAHAARVGPAGVCIAFLFVAGVPAQAQSSGASSSDVPASVLAAQERIKHGQEQDAIVLLQKLAIERPAPRGAFKALGVAYYRTGKLADAENSFRNAIAEDPKDLDAVQMLGLTLYRLGKPDAALPYLERARTSTQASDVDADYVLGRCYIDAHRYDDARRAFAAQYGLDPESGAAYELNAQMLVRVELPDQAEIEAQRALTLAPKLAMAHFILGKIYLARGAFESALQEFERERSINPTYPELYQFLGDLYAKVGRRREAQHALTEALSLDQSNTGPFISMGRLFLDDDDPQTAVSYLQHAEQMDPSNYITHYLLSQAFRRMGRTDDTRRELEIVSTIHSNEDRAP
jgi:predicted Zn-dependent protease